MNYLHPQLFFPISIFFFLSVLLFRGEGVLVQILVKKIWH